MRMSWDRFLHPLIGERRGRDFFVGAMLGGFVLMVMALGDVYLDGPGRLFGGFFGAAMALGSGGTLLLAYADLTEDSRFVWKVIVRIAFLLLGPFAMAMDFSFFLNAGVWCCAALCCLTIIPFGLSLIWLIWKKRKSHS